MKNNSLLSLAAIIVTASIALGMAAVQYSDVFYSVGPCAFLLLIATADYTRQSRYDRFVGQASNLTTGTRASQPLRLAA